MKECAYETNLMSITYRHTQDERLGTHLQQYQIMPVMHAYALGNTANFSVPGSGKTWMAYSTFFLLKHKPVTEEDRVDKLLVIGPLSSFVPWETEYRRNNSKKTKPAKDFRKHYRAFQNI